MIDEGPPPMTRMQQMLLGAALGMWFAVWVLTFLLSAREAALGRPGFLGLWMACTGAGALGLLAFPWTFKGVNHS